MEGLFVSKNKRYISWIGFNTYSLSLLATGGGVDVIQYDITMDKPCHIYPGEKPGLLEFYYVLDGVAVLKLPGEDVVLNKGEYFHAYNLKEIVNFTTVNGAKLLCVTSQPTFKSLLDYHEGLNKLLESAEAKDLYTYNHGYRVQMYSMKIGEKMDLADESIYTLQVASLFHDIGKCRVPDAILQKPGKLTAEEYERVKKHAIDSSMLLEGQFEARITAAVEQHHERLDGSGYPKGLRGGQINLEARIIAAADAFDAMTSDRAYRKAQSPESAIRELENLAGIHYDADVVKTLRAVLEDEGTISRKPPLLFVAG